MKAAVKAELDRLKAQSRNDMLDPKAVLVAARDPKSPLHGYFTWNVRQAATKFWMQQAHQLISEYKVVITTTRGEPIKVRHFVSLTTDRANGGGYRTIDEVMNDDQMRAQMFEDALIELHRFQGRFSRLQELQPVFVAIDEVAKKPTKGKPTRRAATRRPEARAQ